MLMSTLEILKYPDPRLREVAVPVEIFDADLHTFLDKMKEAMYAFDGIGLAATQVGIMKRIAVIDITQDCTGYTELINPTLYSSEGAALSKEGCLSIPQFRETITRHASIVVKAFDRYGKEFSFTAEELLSFCVQHEIDHLNGVLFIDHLSPIKKQFFTKWVKKQQELETTK